MFPNRRCMGSKNHLLIITLFTAILFSFRSEARPYYYPQVRYVGSSSESMGGGVLSNTDELGNAMMNNPAGLARFKGFRAEPLNLNFSMNSNLVSNVGTALLGSTTLGGISSTMNSNTSSPFGLGGSNLTAFSWGGVAVGFLWQEHSRAISDGTTASYQAVSQFIPTIGYGFGLARNIIRVGYSLQYVNETSGTATATSDSSASYLSGLSKGSGLSHNVSINFSLPFTYLPSLSVIARNLGGLHFTGSRLLSRGTNFSGTLASENMSVDASFDFLVKITSNLKTHWYLEYRDLGNHVSFPSYFERINMGVDLALNRSISFRGGMTGIANFSAGLGYRSENGEINLAYYKEKSPFSYGDSWDTRYALQYKVMLYEQAKKADGELQEVGSKR